MRARISVIFACVATALSLLVPGTAAGATTAPPPPEGGRAIFGSNGARCVIGFNVVRNGSYYFLTAGGCAQGGLHIYADEARTVPLGTVAQVMGGGFKVALAQYVDPKKQQPGTVHTYPGSLEITSAGMPSVGQRVCRSGPVSHVVCGSVTAVNQTINLPDGVINGVSRTSICASELPGAPYFTDGRAVGMEIGTSGGCVGGTSSYFQPISPVLSAFGVAVY
ncbi:S1 family peptidase [Actinomadura terrae]|uniref:S1 family peptidase n=1 Tax=Actinomadura terrae TaxID=604353 RepID=UPI001FA6B9B5|nr:S1 family peptidase [Actinomadura terrae]